MRLKKRTSPAKQRDHRPGAVDPASDRAGAECRGHEYHRPRPGRIRHRQGVYRKFDPLQFRPREQAYMKINCGAIPETFSNRNCSAMKKALSPMPVRSGKADLKRPTAARFFSTRSARCRCRHRCGCSGCCRTANLPASAAATSSSRMCESSRLQTSTLKRPSSDGKFQKDLFYRLSVFPITLPPLRERIEDIHPLVFHFLEQYKEKTGRFVSGISKEALRALINYEWPGNVRELENAIERAVIIASGRQIELDDLPEAISRRAFEAFAARASGTCKSRTAKANRSVSRSNFPPSMDEIEKQVIKPRSTTPKAINPAPPAC